MDIGKLYSIMIEDCAEEGKEIPELIFYLLFLFFFLHVFPHFHCRYSERFRTAWVSFIVSAFSRFSIKDFFEQYYKKYEKFMTLPSVPAAMLAEQQEEEGEWKKWKLIPATVSDEDLAKLEVLGNLVEQISRPV